MPLLSRLGAACAAAVVGTLFPGLWVAEPAAPSSCSLALVEQMLPAPAGHRATRAYAVDRIAASDIWVVGQNQPESGPIDVGPFAEHWDGTVWRMTAVPDGAGYLSGVAGVRSADVWAVGPSGLLYHWNGSAWSAIAHPPQGDLWDVAALAADDVWVAGESLAGAPLIAHWNGRTWRTVSLPVHSGYLGGITALSANDVWAVGRSNRTYQPMTLHWDGTTWTDVPTPAVLGGILYHVSGTAADDVWAVGFRNTLGDQMTLVEHWAGTRWSIVPSPSRGPVSTHANELHGVSAISRSSVWAVGFVLSQRGGGTLVEHWDGTAWTMRRPPPNPVPGTGRSLWAVTAAPGRNILAVGATGDPAAGEDAERPMAVRHC